MPTKGSGWSGDSEGEDGGDMHPSLLTPYERYALINERLWRFEMEDYLTLEEWEVENFKFRKDRVELHWYKWPERCEA